MSLAFLKGEINKKKRKAEEITKATGTPYVTRGELEKEREQKYLEEQAKIEEARRAKIAKLLEDDENRQHEQDPAYSEQKRISILLPKEEVIKRLKARGEPITYFAETDLQRAERLRKLELMDPIEYTEGSTNEFARSIKEAEEEAAEEEAQAQKIEKDDPLFEIENREPSNAHEKVLFWCRRLLKLWQDDLDNRSEENKRSGSGKRDTATFKQTQSYLRPLLVQLTGKTNEVVPDDIFKHLVKISEACEERDYRKANISYFELAIGNAAWPMGVTMVGIHERSAREKISAASVAHVLNDETQRKYISGMKRLITYHQHKFPTVPSRSVL